MSLWLIKEFIEITNKVISMNTSITKSLLTSLFQREVINPSFPKRGEGRFFNNDALLMDSLVSTSLLSPFGKGG
jgi:hypothetical protein